MAETPHTAYSYLKGLRDATATARLSRREIEDLISTTADAAAMLREAELGDLADIYDKVGLRLTYQPQRQIVRATANPRPRRVGKWSVSEGRHIP